MKKKFLLFSCLFLTLIQLAACGGNSSSAKQATTASKEKTEEVPFGSRENPVALNQVFTYKQKYTDIAGKKGSGTFTIVITDIVRGNAAYTVLHDISTYNSKPPKKQEWVILSVTLSMKEGTTSSPYFLTPAFDVLDGSGYKVEQTQQAILAENEAFGYKNISPGEEISGKVALLSPINSTLSIRYEIDGAKAFFNIK